MKYQKDKVNSKKVKKQKFKTRLYSFVLKLIKFIDKLPNDRVLKIIADQLLRSVTSILANYVEGLSSSTKRELTNYFNHSLKSANESKVWIALLRDAKRAKPEEVKWFLKELDEMSKIFASSILTLKGKR